MRPRLLLLIVIAAIAGGLLWKFWQKPDYRNFPPTGTGPWVAFGDSLTEGLGATEGRDYPSVLSELLGVTITNMGKSGESTVEGLKRLDDAAALKPKVVLLCFGGNDGLQSLPVGQMFGNIGAMIDRFHQEGSFVVLIGIRSPSLRDRNKAGFKKLAREKQVLYLTDFLAGIAFKPIYMSDAIHPNDEGYRRFALRLQKELSPFLEKLR